MTEEELDVLLADVTASAELWTARAGETADSGFRTWLLARAERLRRLAEVMEVQGERVLSDPALAYVPRPQWAPALGAFVCQVCNGTGAPAPHDVAHEPTCLLATQRTGHPSPASGRAALAAVGGGA